MYISGPYAYLLTSDKPRITFWNVRFVVKNEADFFVTFHSDEAEGMATFIGEYEQVGARSRSRPVDHAGEPLRDDSGSSCGDRALGWHGGWCPRPPMDRASPLIASRPRSHLVREMVVAKMRGPLCSWVQPCRGFLLLPPAEICSGDQPCPCFHRDTQGIRLGSFVTRLGLSPPEFVAVVSPYWTMACQVVSRVIRPLRLDLGPAVCPAEHVVCERALIGRYLSPMALSIGAVGSPYDLIGQQQFDGGAFKIGPGCSATFGVPVIFKNLSVRPDRSGGAVYNEGYVSVPLVANETMQQGRRRGSRSARMPEGVAGDVCALRGQRSGTERSVPAFSTGAPRRPRR